MASSLSLLLCAALAATIGAVQRESPEFVAFTTAWSECRRINESVQCYRTRDTSCRVWREETLAPWYYCEEAGQERPVEVEACAEGECVLDCVATSWSEWSSCECEEDAYRTRSREVAFPPQNGGDPCPPLAQRELCDCPLNLTTSPRNYTWSTGRWGACRPLSASKRCGDGVRSRSVDCVDLRGFSVDPSHCLSEPAYANVLPPALEQVCYDPCPCRVSEWSEWTDCEAACDAAPAPRGEQRRQREILQQPTLGAGVCPRTEETRTCSADTSSCPQLSWGTSEWSECDLPEGATCGVGLHRRYRYCLETLPASNSSFVVDEQRCNSRLELKPTTLLPCEIPCPQDCVVGWWSEWTQCPITCESAYSNRTRDVLIPPLAGGSACPHLLELQECPRIPCAQWAVEDFSPCFLYVSSDACGFGEQSRRVYCIDPHGKEIDSELCEHLPRPERGAPCYKPCYNDCVVTDWTSWSECSVTCGSEVGTRTRTREIVVYGSEPCRYGDDDLVEEQNCTGNTTCQLPSYVIEASDWSECVVVDTTFSRDPPTFLSTDVTCGVGFENRTFSCLRDGEAISREDCPISFESMESRSCNIPCPVDCVVSVWSEFSSCSADCGSGEMRQSRRLLQPPRLGGEECPLGIDTETGMEWNVSDCELPACQAEHYSWDIGHWSDCHILPTPLSTHTDSSACGLGYRNRSISCVDTEGEMVDELLCYQLSGDVPESLQSCTERCRDHCIITEWTQFTTCSGGFSTRTREVMAVRGSPDWTDDCPEVADVETFQSVSCNKGDDRVYNWVPHSLWGECILESPTATCGSGFEYRSYPCTDITDTSNLLPVSEEYCVRGSPATKQRCVVVCPEACQLSDWSEWSECSTTCGWGYQARSREGEETCGHLTETTVCYNSQPCQLAEWELGPISLCRPINESSLCGEGSQTQVYVCVIDGIEQPDITVCSSLPPAPVPVERSCSVPCDGECVLGPWSSWTECPQDCTSTPCSRQRTRQKLRGECSLSDRTTQLQTCPEYVNHYAWLALGWTDCILMASGNVDYCGNGTQRRPVECVDVRTNATVADQYCSTVEERPVLVQACEIPCPVDCQLGPFGPWTECPDACAFNLWQNRSRDILVMPYNGGKSCSVTEELRPCLPICDHYVIREQQTYHSPELTLNSMCGSELSTAVLSCLRNGQFLPMEVCVTAVHEGVQVQGAELLEASMEKYFETECLLKPECSYLPWMEWNECTSACELEEEGISYRTRGLVWAYNDTQPQCLSGQYELMSCDVGPNVTCVEFQWATSEWDRNGQRNVWCQDASGAEVSPTGCVPELQPAELRSCPAGCEGYADCNNATNQCECSTLYEMVDSVCLPVQGCASDEHCLHPGTVCNLYTRTCECTGNRELRNGECIAIPPPHPTQTKEPTRPTAPVQPTPPETNPTIGSSGTTDSMATTASNSPNIPDTTPTVTEPTDDSGGSSSGLGEFNNLYANYNNCN